MNLASRWKKTEDPSAKVISALTTKITDLEQKFQANATNNVNFGASKPKLHIPVWRTENKGEMCQRDRNTWYWCPHHKKEGLFDGLYMPHKPEEHDAWAKKKKEEREKRSRSKDDSSSESKPKLQLTDSMRQALVTNGYMTPEQATVLWTRMMGN